jgi:hypothetical protein
MKADQWAEPMVVQTAEQTAVLTVEPMADMLDMHLVELWVVWMVGVKVGK